MADVILYLVDRSLLDELLGMEVSEISSSMEKSTLRKYRPNSEQGFHRDFDVDLEGEVLELIDSSVELQESIRINDSISDASLELSLLLAKWCASAEWRCWDARLFLYVEPYLEYPVNDDTGSFLVPDLWKQFSEALSSMDRTSYSESVVLDWMGRRQEMGETMEPSNDPMILPTMESHRSLSDSLFKIMERYRSSEMQLMIGRDFIYPGEWSIGKDTFSQLWGHPN